MDRSRFAWTRRRLLQQAGGLAAAAVAPPALAATPATPAVTGTPASSGPAAPPLLDAVAAVCHRLAPAGWRDLLLRVSGNELDLTAGDLGAALTRSLPHIDRHVPGFEDFALEGARGIEPGSPARSLLFHALASPNVFQDGAGHTLAAFPTPAEIEAVENYVYGVQPPSLDEVRARAGGNPLAVVVFAFEYRPGPETVAGKHADLCFSRTGMARAGTAPATYDAQRRMFAPAIDSDPFAFPVQPARYAPFLAVQRHGDPAAFGPLRATPDDGARRFWVPLHKLFSGSECLRGLDLTVELSTGHRNDNLRRFHEVLGNAGFETGWGAPDIDQYPFVIEGDELAALSTDSSHGTGWVMPSPHPFSEAATYQGKPLAFYSSPAFAASATGLYVTTLQVFIEPPFRPLGPARTQALPENQPTHGQTAPNYLTDIGPDVGRSAPEYLNVRRKVAPDGSEQNLNDLPDVEEVVKQAGYWARHQIDRLADGWVAVQCRQLDEAVPARVPAYSLVAPPDFYPYTNQRALTEWAEREAPAELRDGIWSIPPRPLSDRRLAANVTLSNAFDIADDTVTTLVSLPQETVPAQSGVPATWVRRPLHLPDGLAGLFDPGWDVSLDRTADNRFFLAGHGLGTPFVEDVKLCATLSTFWPGVSPDAVREFQPGSQQQPSGEPQSWPTIAPMTDEELGMVAVPGRGFLPWDGVRGPSLTTVGGEQVIDYPEFAHTDYLETEDKFTAALTGAVDHAEYTARVLAMAQVYWALGIRFADYSRDHQIGEALDLFQAAKAAWTVLSFRALGEGADADLERAEATLGATLQGQRRYRFVLYQWSGQDTPASDVRRILVPMTNQVIAYSDLTTVLLGRGGDHWSLEPVPH